ncbi:MAG: transposase [Deinococcota bacterium]
MVEGRRFAQPVGQNGFAESFHSRLREECLNQEVFSSARHAGVVLDSYRSFYNARRPHSSLGYRTPDQFAEQPRREESSSGMVWPWPADFAVDGHVEMNWPVLPREQLHQRRPQQLHGRGEFPRHDQGFSAKAHLIRSS